MITGENFIALAGKLAAASQLDEVTCRTVIGRAYYGAFHLVKQYLESLGLRVARDHGELQRSLMESGNPQALAAGSLLVDLHRSRIWADYDLTNRRVTQARFAQECVEVAADLRSILRALEGEPVRQQVKAGIEAYRKRIGR